MFAFSGIVPASPFFTCTRHVSFIFPYCTSALQFELRWSVVALGYLDVRLPCPNMFVSVRLCFLSGFMYQDHFHLLVWWYCARVSMLGQRWMTSMHLLFCCELNTKMLWKLSDWHSFACLSDVYHTSHEFSGWLLSASWTLFLGVSLSLHTKIK